MSGPVTSDGSEGCLPCEVVRLTSAREMAWRVALASFLTSALLIDHLMGGSIPVIESLGRRLCGQAGWDRTYRSRQVCEPKEGIFVVS